MWKENALSSWLAPERQPARRQILQCYSFKELNSANNVNSLEVDFSLEPLDNSPVLVTL